MYHTWLAAVVAVVVVGVVDCCRRCPHPTLRAAGAHLLAYSSGAKACDTLEIDWARSIFWV